MKRHCEYCSALYLRSAFMENKNILSMLLGAPTSRLMPYAFLQKQTARPGSAGLLRAELCDNTKMRQ
jgi:hypothetical protein